MLGENSLFLGNPKGCLLRAYERVKDRNLRLCRSGWLLNKVSTRAIKPNKRHPGPAIVRFILIILPSVPAGAPPECGQPGLAKLHRANHFKGCHAIGGLRRDDQLASPVQVQGAQNVLFPPTRPLRCETQEFCSTKNLRPYRHNLQIVGIWSLSGAI
jgi:hypothetical protein